MNPENPAKSNIGIRAEKRLFIYKARFYCITNPFQKVKELRVFKLLFNKIIRVYKSFNTFISYTKNKNITN